MTMTTRCFLSAAVMAAVLGASWCADNARATPLAARVSVTGTTDGTTVGTVTQQTPGPVLTVATSPANLGDLTLLLDGSPMPQANGVVFATPNQFRYAAVGDRNMIEVPGELSNTIPGGFPNGMWLSTTKVSGSGAEENFNLSLVHFPFADGWKAGHVNGSNGSLYAGNSADTTITHLPNLPTAAFGTGHYQLSIAGVDSRTSGMLFAIGAENSSSGNVVPVAPLPDGSGWDVRINDQGGNFPATEQADWSYVYVPYGATNLVAAGYLQLVPVENSTAPPTAVNALSSVGTFTAGLVDIGNSTTNASIIPPSAGPDGLNDAGRILITIPGKSSATGVLMVGVSKYATTSVSGADDNFVVYEYNADLGGFLVETYDLSGANLQNSDIYFAYFDYDNPIGVPEPASLWLAAVAIAVAGFLRARRRTK